MNIISPLYSRILPRGIFFGIFLVLVATTPHLVWADEGDFKEGFQSDTAIPAGDPSFQNYSGLADVITMICENAMERFRGFYGPSVVMVVPFSSIGFSEKDKQSELGVILADQMVVMINNDTKDNLGSARGDIKQQLHGVLLEVDGYLRVHLSGINAAGQRTSYVVIVEMSEPIYRALHTHL
ncbi:MAG: hypothetical protein KKD63_02870 [Proteobacteria bacterium]|nr:hypothetical protein [Desulfobulbaceae bacterium]MBU4151802.1 hypothetical protein [Pseudomonadota bacterium]MDP2105844.1 hypothetical protein [Desulfobulbaceae bacterium]